MKIRHRINKGFATVDDELGGKLIESELWEAHVEPPKETASSKPVKPRS